MVEVIRKRICIFEGPRLCALRLSLFEGSWGVDCERQLYRLVSSGHCNRPCALEEAMGYVFLVSLESFAVVCTADLIDETGRVYRLSGL